MPETRVVIDSNILFRALRSANKAIRDALDTPDCSFYAPNFVMLEIFKHKERLLKNAPLSEPEMLDVLKLLLAKIHFLPEESIALENAIAAHRLCSGIDENDTPFLALALELDAQFWSMDEVLKSGLKKKGYWNFYTPPET